MSVSKPNSTVTPAPDRVLFNQTITLDLATQVWAVVLASIQHTLAEMRTTLRQSVRESEQIQFAGANWLMLRLPNDGGPSHATISLRTPPSGEELKPHPHQESGDKLSSRSISTGRFTLDIWNGVYWAVLRLLKEHTITEPKPSDDDIQRFMGETYEAHGDTLWVTIHVPGGEVILQLPPGWWSKAYHGMM
jgi:hypothetical protein